MNLTSEQWATVRRFAYAIVPLVGNLLIALGAVSTEMWQIISGIVLQVVAFAVAFWNTSPTNPSDVEGVEPTTDEVEPTQL